MNNSATRVDAITFEVLRNKLQAIVNEQTITLKQVSGSPIVTEAADYNTGIYLPDGTPVIRGLQIILHASSVAQMIKSVIEDCEKNPGIREGDMFFINDPWKGAPHQSDVGVVAPHFYKGRLIAWSGAVAHLLDIGGMVHGSWCPEATEKFQEGVSFPPIKIVEGETVRSDVTAAILGQSRLPFLVALDLKAMIASNITAKRRLGELIERYGADVTQAVLQGLVDRAEEAMRRRLRDMPDGVYRGVDFLDHDGHQNKLYKIAVTLTKENDTLTFDFSGTSEQAPGMVNCTEVGMRGGVATPLLITLAYDLEWNGGVLRPIKIIGKKGIICNAEMPAPVSGASVSAARVVMNACTQALSRLIFCSDKFRKEARAVTSGTFMTLNLRGISQYGERYGTMNVDPMACGEGAYEFRDGADAHGNAGSPRTNMPNVETNEHFAPVMYLYRRIVPDTGGPGKFRGGNTAGLAFGIHGEKAQEAVLCGHGVESPNSQGLAGGLPGSCVVNTLRKETDLKEKLAGGYLTSDPQELHGQEVDVGAKPGNLTFGPKDVFEYTWQGGGGWGDPLERPAEKVQQDVAGGCTSVAWARRAYGVILDPRTLEVQSRRTEAERQKMRRRRIESGIPPAAPAAQLEEEPIHVMNVGPDLELVAIGGRKVIRCKCGFQFAPADHNWKEGALRRILGPRNWGPYRKLHHDLEMREYICPKCGVLHSVEISRKEDPPLWEVQLKA